MLLIVGIVWALLGTAPAFETLPHGVLEAPEGTRVSGTFQALSLGQAVSELEKEMERLELASRRLDQQCTELLGEPKDGQGRQVKLPEDHDELISYLKGCVSFVENVDESFGELLAGEGQVHLPDRVIVARKHIHRLEKSGRAGVLIRRQVRAWIEKDMQAVEALNADWPEIRASVDDLVRTARGFESGREPIGLIGQKHQHVLKCSSRRTRFNESKLGLLCQQLNDSATRL